MKKLLSLFCGCALAVCMTVGCNTAADNTTSVPKDAKEKGGKDMVEKKDKSSATSTAPSVKIPPPPK